MSFLGNIDPEMNDLSSENDTLSSDSQSDYSSDENEASHDQIEIERQNFLQQLIEFIRDANLNKTTTSSLLSLLNSSKFYDEIPASINQLVKKLDIKFYYDIFVYCSTCFTLLSKIQDRCINCGNPKKKANSELIIFSIADELRRVVQPNIELIKWYSFRENQMISDIVFGDIYKEQCSNNSTLTLMITTDGKPMIRSKATRTSVWPVMSTLVEIPPFIRERLDNMMLLGLWHSPVTPPTDLLLSKIVYLIKSLTMTGIDILVGKKFEHFDVRVQLMTGDLPARAKCNKLNSYNGFYACSRCLIEGRRCASPCKQHTLYRWLDYLPCRHLSRTQEHINQCVLLVSGDSRTSYGVLGSSPISSILSIPLQSTLDYFHLALEVHLSLFSTESCLHHIEKLSHGSISLGQQISYWWCIHRQMNSRKMINRPTLFTKAELILDSFFVYGVLENYRQEFHLVYNQTFGELPSPSMKFYSRYVHGLIVYHSTSYSRRNNCNSFSVLIDARNSRGERVNCFGQILFYFYVDNRPFYFVKQFFESKNQFSSLIRPSQENPKWEFYLNEYYSLICHAKSRLIIYPCSSIISKCIIFRLDDKYSACTPVELELEHD
ncbi:unnamed protein product [Rotaria sp. Silwood2]|nr:unnamed protein product [Rotaria sp. Silwood2]CAF2946862.1 unnamed protein product [Rotaria sp. Silwood2]CAF3130925.1 unnamed protein product [Rotaria sp. Silwood2]CAF4066472.1 unnamed protein product [Rotaria sp. Silwood2]CAF4396814.1 unnamed protein product [Rotaria sp. Silwood2]